ncbi:MAG TPA: CGNR zinc finger domain-containing protein [Ilumatobacteraceae bacterium]|nr:CGNR zinc finger domain-containing protein [Ilumatobacteraceae bacterium]
MTATVQPLPDEPLAIRLLNTTWSGDTGEVDLLDERADLARWLASVDVAARATEEMRVALRAARSVIAAYAADPDETAARQALNALLEQGAITRTLGAGGEVVRSVTVDESRLPGWMAADDLLDIITNRPGRIRQCAHPRCVLWFLDTSRNASRRWCSMAGCGNRAKAQQHYRRHRHSNT